MSVINGVNTSSVPNVPIILSNTTIYVGNWYNIAGGTNILFCSIGITVELLFLIGSYPLSGWKSNFSFSLHMAVALCGLQRDVVTLIAIVLSLTSIIQPSYTFWRRLLGNLCIVPELTVMPLIISLTIHRIFYTLFPFTAPRICNKIVCQSTILTRIITLLYGIDIACAHYEPQELVTASIWLTIVLLYHLSCIVFMQTFDISSMIWSVSTLYPAVWGYSQNTYLVYFVIRINNFVVGFFNLVTFPILFAVLYSKGQLTFKKNKELRLTLHVCYVVIFEVSVSLYAEFSSQGQEQPTPESLLINSLYGGSYFFVIILPYLFLNRNIRQRICCLQNSVHIVPGSQVMVEARSRHSTTN